MSPLENPEDWRAESRAGWEAAAPGWGGAADRVHDWAAGVSTTMVEALALAPGARVLELAAGPGDTGFMAAALIQPPDDGGAARTGEAGRRAGGVPPGTLICSDGAEAMLDVARERAAARGIHNVEFRQLELEWIDLETATVDAVLCRWGIMLVVDPEAAAREIRRVLRPGGRAALAVWDVAERNPWATIPREAVRGLGLAPAPDSDAPNQFSLAADGALAELLQSAGFTDVTVVPVAMQRRFASVDAYLAETAEVAPSLARTLGELDDAQRAQLHAEVSDAARPFRDDDGSLVLPGSSLVAAAAA